MDVAPGTVVLRPQPWVRVVTPLVALFFGVAAVGAYRGRHGSEMPYEVAWIATVVCGLLALLMAYATWAVPRQSFHVTAYGVTVMNGSRVRFELPFSGLTEVRPYLTSRQRVLRMSRHALAVTGTTPDGTQRTLRIGNLVPTLRPLLEALSPVVASRPELFPGDAERHLFRLFLDEAPAVRPPAASGPPPGA